MPYPVLPVVVESSGDEVVVDVDPIELVLELSAVVSSGVTVPSTPPDPGEVPEWTVRVVKMDGELVGHLENATVETITKTLGAEDEFAFSSPKYDPATMLVRPLREVQVYRFDNLKTWGPVVSAAGTSSEGSIGFAGRGVYWYFRRRFFGTAERRNMLPNGDFELGAADGTLGGYLPGWTTVGDVQRRHWTAATKPGGHGLPDPLRGEKAISLASDEEGQNGYVRSRFEYRTEFPPGQRLTFAAWVYIADGWIGPAALNLGLYVERIVGGVRETASWALIDDDTKRDDWVRLECSMIVRPDRDGYVEVRLYSPAGWVVWDEAVSVLMESTGAGFTPTDQVNIAGTIVRYGQEGRGKSPLNIGTSTPATGVLRRRAWQHADHEWLSTALEELAAHTDGFDFDVLLTPVSRTYRTHFPGKGRDLSGDVVLTLGAPADGGNIASYTISEDGANVSTSIVARGAGDGPDREEGGAIDADELDGLVLEQYLDAPTGLPIGELDDYAANELEVSKDVVEVLELVTHQGAGDLIDTLEEGDFVSVLIDDGYVQVDAVYRIVRLVIVCRTNTLAVTVNRIGAH